MPEREKTKVALVGDVALELMAPYFKEAGLDVYVPAGFAAWRQELLDARSGLRAFRPDFVYDVTEAATALADEVPGFRDERMAALASMPYSLDGIRAIVEEFGYWRLRGPRKVLAVDADNTLWKGILSEDGEAGLSPCLAFQRGLADLRREGVTLILLSKNDREPLCRAMENARKRFGSDALAPADFAAVKVNWGPKAGNLVEACRELNLGVDSVVFVDDNPHERAQMSAHLPEVAVVPWNGWGEGTDAESRQLLRRLRTHFFSGMGATAEDRLRAADYASRARATGYASLDDYLADLELTVVSGEATADDLDRLAQMAGKTNQFNATTIRRGRDEFAALLADAGTRIFTFRTRDRFAEQGLVCYVVVRGGRITDFVMSCRAMGRTLERHAYAFVTERLGYAPEIDFVPTAKNAPFAAFLKEAKTGGKTYYREEGPWRGK